MAINLQSGHNSATTLQLTYTSQKLRRSKPSQLMGVFTINFTTKVVDDLVRTLIRIPKLVPIDVFMILTYNINLCTQRVQPEPQQQEVGRAHAARDHEPQHEHVRGRGLAARDAVPHHHDKQRAAVQQHRGQGHGVLRLREADPERQHGRRQQHDADDANQALDRRLEAVARHVHKEGEHARERGHEKVGGPRCGDIRRQQRKARVHAHELRKVRRVVEEDAPVPLGVQVLVPELVFVQHPVFDEPQPYERRDRDRKGVRQAKQHVIDLNAAPAESQLRVVCARKRPCRPGHVDGRVAARCQVHARHQRRVAVAHGRAVHVHRTENQRRGGVALDARVLVYHRHQPQEQRLQEAEGHEPLAAAVAQLQLPPRVQLRPEARLRAAEAAETARQLSARVHELFRAQEHAVQVAEQHEHEHDRDQVALMELQFHAVGSSALKLFMANTSKFHLCNINASFEQKSPVNKVI